MVSAAVGDEHAGTDPKTETVSIRHASSGAARRVASGSTGQDYTVPVLPSPVQSLRHALRGIETALRTERNFRLFVAATIAVLAAAAWFDVTRTEWIALILATGTFLAIELLNTALERVGDALDEHVIRAVKDIASAAALLSGLAAAVTVFLILGPHVLRLH